MATCAAHKTNGEPCKSPAMHGKRVCRAHGGLTPSGFASPHFKTGRYSKYIPARMMARYDEAMADPQLLEMRADLALIESRLAELLERVDSGESGRLWSSLQAARLEMLDRRSVNDQTGQIAALGDILRLIGEGHADYRAWGEVATVLEQRRRIVEAEHKRLIAAQQMITVDKAMLLIGAIGGVIRAHVQDRAQLSAISRAIEELVSRE